MNMMSITSEISNIIKYTKDTVQFILSCGLNLDSAREKDRQIMTIAAIYLSLLP